MIRRRDRLDWFVAILAVATMFVASQVLLALGAPWYWLLLVLVLLWAVLMLYYRGRQADRGGRRGDEPEQ